MSDWFDALSTGRNLLISLAGMLLCLVFFGALERTLGAGILDLMPSYSMNEVQARFEIYGADGRRLYALASVSLDLLFPISYSCFFIGIIIRLVESNILKWLVVIPMMLASVDLLENIQFCIMLNQFPDLSESQIYLASLTTMIKHQLTLGVYMCIVCLAAFKVFQKLIFKLK